MMYYWRNREFDKKLHISYAIETLMSCINFDCLLPLHIIRSNLNTYYFELILAQLTNSAHYAAIIGKVC